MGRLYKRVNVIIQGKTPASEFSRIIFYDIRVTPSDERDLHHNYDIDDAVLERCDYPNGGERSIAERKRLVSAIAERLSRGLLVGTTEDGACWAATPDEVGPRKNIT